MMVAVVLQVSQTTVNCRFRRIRSLRELFRIQLYQGQLRTADTKVEIFASSM